MRFSGFPSSEFGIRIFSRKFWIFWGFVLGIAKNFKYRECHVFTSTATLHFPLTFPNTCGQIQVSTWSELHSSFQVSSSFQDSSQVSSQASLDPPKKETNIFQPSIFSCKNVSFPKISSTTTTGPFFHDWYSLLMVQKSQTTTWDGATIPWNLWQ